MWCRSAARSSSGTDKPPEVQQAASSSSSSSSNELYPIWIDLTCIKAVTELLRSMCTALILLGGDLSRRYCAAQQSRAEAEHKHMQLPAHGLTD
ncbi:hypothetical protein J7T55_000564 [Diaporthe amygdali]|uniref:uncharacterized protein n=1 Tax=Phomopsis amygdali TaxID=1214568 RepID=UPI0022FED206|nr:uncharacterized protein J7T55_000564 [Diaporthe amygdali]KAJ0110132.1 hypothetical protein J7T55_000564 [Diaporthe amygdali]